MAEKKNLPIPFFIQGIETKQYALLDFPGENKALQYGVNFSYGVDIENHLIQCIFNYKLQFETKSVLTIEVAIDFVIEPAAFKKSIAKSKGLTIPKDFATHLAMICVGTTRGILHEKTLNTEFNSFPIPTINVSQEITEDIIFED